MLSLLRVLWIIICALLGAAAGAILIGQFNSIGLSILGGVIGLVIGGVLGKFIPFWEWFA